MNENVQSYINYKAKKANYLVYLEAMEKLCDLAQSSLLERLLMAHKHTCEAEQVYKANPCNEELQSKIDIFLLEQSYLCDCFDIKNIIEDIQKIEKD